MPKIKRTYPLYAFHIPVIALVLIAAVVVSGAVVVTSNSSEGSVLGKNDNKEGKEKKEKAQKASEKSKEHKQKVEEVSKTLKEVAKKEERRGNIKVSSEIEEIAETQESSAEEVSKAIEKVESKPKWKVLLTGTDYKNIGQLRSSLAHNTNDIRKITKLMNQVESSESSGILQTQLNTLLAERQKITEVISTNENQFSLLGWVFKLLYGSKGSGGESTQSTGTN